MMAALADFYPATCTIQVATESRDAAGQPIPSWANLASHVGIPCAVASISGTETETQRQTYVLATHRIALRGSYTAITEAHRAVVGGVTYDIERVHQDSRGATTYLDVQIVT